MYTAPHQFEPLLPSDARMEPLLSEAHDLSRAATLLAGTRVPPELRSPTRRKARCVSACRSTRCAFCSPGCGRRRMQ